MDKKRNQFLPHNVNMRQRRLFGSGHIKKNDPQILASSRTPTIDAWDDNQHKNAVFIEFKEYLNSDEIIMANK